MFKGVFSPHRLCHVTAAAWAITRQGLHQRLNAAVQLTATCGQAIAARRRSPSVGSVGAIARRLTPSVGSVGAVFLSRCLSIKSSMPPHALRGYSGHFCRWRLWHHSIKSSMPPHIFRGYSGRASGATVGCPRWASSTSCGFTASCPRPRWADSRPRWADSGATVRCCSCSSLRCTDDNASPSWALSLLCSSLRCTQLSPLH